jgi:hypothetical protein
VLGEPDDRVTAGPAPVAMSRVVCCELLILTDIDLTPAAYAADLFVDRAGDGCAM